MTKSSAKAFVLSLLAYLSILLAWYQVWAQPPEPKPPTTHPVPITLSQFQSVPEPVKTEPVKTEPVKTEPVKTEPVKTEPVKTEPVKTEPVKTEPVKTELVKTEPVKTEPVKTEPVKTEPVKTEPVKTEPVKTEPVKTESVKTESVKTESVKTESVKTESVKTESVKTESVKTEPVKTEPVKTEPVKTEPVKTEPVKTEPAKPQYSLAESMSAEHRYLAELSDLLARYAQDTYPRRAKRRGWEADVTVTFRILPNGRIVDLEIVDPSDQAIFDQAALAIFRDRLQMHFKPFPDQIQRSSWMLSVPISYRLR